MPIAMHDSWCNWVYKTRDANRADVAFCAGCGLFVQLTVIGSQP